jgi:hypothetical protein
MRKFRIDPDDGGELPPDEPTPTTPLPKKP